MNNLIERSLWEIAVRQINDGDRVKGGESGTINLQAMQLANRTQYLNNLLSGVKSGELPFSRAEDAQTAFNNGYLDEGAIFSIRSENPNIWATEYKIENGRVELSLDSSGNQKDIQTKLFTEGFFLESDDDSIYGGFIDALGQLGFYFDSMGNFILGENSINVNVTLRSLLSSISTINNQLPSLVEYAQHGGYVDNNGYLAFYFNERGDLILGDGDINLTEFVKNGGGTSGYIAELQREINGNTKAIYCLGDSLTAGAGAAGNGYVEQLSAALQPLGFTVVKNAVGGQGSADIATRSGGYVNQITLKDNIIPTTGAAAIISSTRTPITNQGGGPIKGTLNGIVGTVAATFDASGNRTSHTFTRSTAGDAVYVDNATPFITPMTGHEFDINVLWYGRNDVKKEGAKDIIVDSLQASIEHLKAKNKRFIILSILNGDYNGTEAKGSEGYNTIININETIKARWPRNYIEVRKALVLAYDPGSEIDTQNFLDDIPPSSLRADGIHLNAKGYEVIMKCVKTALQQRGWL